MPLSSRFTRGTKLSQIHEISTSFTPSEVSKKSKGSKIVSSKQSKLSKHSKLSKQSELSKQSKSSKHSKLSKHSKSSKHSDKTESKENSKATTHKSTIKENSQISKKTTELSKSLTNKKKTLSDNSKKTEKLKDIEDTEQESLSNTQSSGNSEEEQSSQTASNSDKSEVSEKSKSKENTLESKKSKVTEVSKSLNKTKTKSISNKEDISIKMKTKNKIKNNEISLYSRSTINKPAPVIKSKTMSLKGSDFSNQIKKIKTLSVKNKKNNKLELIEIPSTVRNSSKKVTTPSNYSDIRPFLKNVEKRELAGLSYSVISSVNTISEKVNSKENESKIEEISNLSEDVTQNKKLQIEKFNKILRPKLVEIPKGKTNIFQINRISLKRTSRMFMKINTTQLSPRSNKKPSKYFKIFRKHVLAIIFLKRYGVRSMVTIFFYF
jgi:hypothetical protein